MPRDSVRDVKGLHHKEMQRLVNQLQHMDKHAKELISVLNCQLEITYASAPKRVRTYLLDRSERRNPVRQQRERLLEKAIWKQWQSDPFADGLYHHIQTFQMPLKHRQSDKGWGKVDLIGVTQEGLPVVLELKREKSDETPLRMLVEGLAYAVCVRRAWNEGTLRSQWERDVTKLSKGFTAPKILLEVPVVGIAPKKYWQTKIGNKKGKRTAGQVPVKAWKSFEKLCKKCSERGFPVSFLQFGVDGEDDAGLPKIVDVEQRTLP